MRADPDRHVARAESPERRWREGRVALALGALVVLVGSTLLAGPGEALGWEVVVFGWCNGLPAGVSSALWPVVQLGSILVVPAMALMTAACADGRRAIAVATAGTGAWIGAELCKAAVGRGRPGELLSDVLLHGVPSSGAGFPSGHVAVAAAIATVLATFLPAAWRAVAGAVVVLVGLGRMTSGAHLPLDIAAGGAIGVITGLGALEMLARIGRRA